MGWWGMYRVPNLDSAGVPSTLTITVPLASTHLDWYRGVEGSFWGVSVPLPGDSETY